MAITVDNINTGGAVVTHGGSVSAVDTDGYYIGTTGGIDVGCTNGGVKIAYTYETSDIFCDQTLAPVSTSITNESATIEFEMLESASANLRYAIGQYVSLDDPTVDFMNKTGVGGVKTVNYDPLMLTIPKTSNSALEYIWTFFRTRPGGLETTYSRENPTGVSVTFTAYADTSHAAGHQLFSIKEELPTT